MSKQQNVFESIMHKMDPDIIEALKRFSIVASEGKKTEESITADDIDNAMIAMENIMFDIVTGQINEQESSEVILLFYFCGFSLCFIEAAIHEVAKSISSMQEN